MKKILFAPFLLFGIYVYSQEIAIKDTVKLHNIPFETGLIPAFEHSFPEINFQPDFRFNNSLITEHNNRISLYDFQRLGNIQLPPAIPIEIEPLYTHAPYDINFNLYNRYPVNDYSWFSTSRSQQEYIGLGGVNIASGMYNVRLGERFTVSGGLYGGKYTLNNAFFNDAGVQGNASFLVNDRIKLHTFGNYSFNNTPTPFGAMYPQTSYGGAVEIKVTEKWGVMMGAEREFDVWRGKWVTRPIVYPVFY